MVAFLGHPEAFAEAGSYCRIGGRGAEISVKRASWGCETIYFARQPGIWVNIALKMHDGSLFCKALTGVLRCFGKTEKTNVVQWKSGVK